MTPNAKREPLLPKCPLCSGALRVVGPQGQRVHEGLQLMHPRYMAPAGRKCCLLENAQDRLDAWNRRAVDVEAVRKVAEEIKNMRGEWGLTPAQRETFIIWAAALRRAVGGEP